MIMAAKRKRKIVKRRVDDELRERLGVVERGLVTIESRVAALEKPRVAMVFDPSRPEGGRAA
jgi:hypothetical protein